jgi:DNA-directed RNA polymerase specialized sigma24 family protein
VPGPGCTGSPRTSSASSAGRKYAGCGRWPGPARTPSRGWVEDTADLVADRAPLEDALAALSAADRHVLLLVAWVDLTYQEVAEALGIPVGTVRCRLNRARRKVRASLGADPAFLGEVA